MIRHRLAATFRCFLNSLDIKMPEEIKIPLSMVKGDDLVSGDFQHIILHDNHIDFFSKATIMTKNYYDDDLEDDQEIVDAKEVKIDYDFSALKSSVTAVVMKRDDLNEVFKVIIELNGGSDLSTCFKKRREAMDLKDKITKWLVS